MALDVALDLNLKLRGRKPAGTKFAGYIVARR
jgi:hypothetical protein